MPRRPGFCPCAHYTGRARVVRKESLGSSDDCPLRALDCYYLALYGEIFDGFPNIDWAYIIHPRYPGKWVRHALHRVPHPRIVDRRLRRCRSAVAALEFDEQILLANSTRAPRSVDKRRALFELWVRNVNKFLDGADAEIARWLP